ncbi:MAG: VanW family protein [bacterium]|jgi:vancomycin resistance protein YoaR|nr:VanW family protein [bacterium]
MRLSRSLKCGGGASGRFLPLFVISVVCLAGLMLSLHFYFFSGILRPSVFINSMSLKGCTKGEITKIVWELSNQVMQGQVLLKSSRGSWLFSPEELGVKAPGNELVERIWTFGNGRSLWLRVRNWWRTMRAPLTVPLSVNIDGEMVKAIFSTLAGQIEVAAEPASLFSFDDGSMKIHRGKPGLTINRKKTINVIKQSFQNDPFVYQKEVDIVFAQLPVNPDFGTFQEKSGLTVELATFSTEYDESKASRKVNLTLASEAIDGWIIAPGEEFSFNEAVGPRTVKRGFKAASSIIGGKLIADIGGGICQVTTTLYNSVLLANLEIIKRYPHSMYFIDSAYVPQGRDAAVVWGHKDFVIRNTLDQSVLISSRLKDGQQTVTLYGSKPTKVKVKLWQEGLRVLTAETITKIDPQLLPGIEKVEDVGNDGYSVTAFQEITYPDGKTENRTLSRDIYRSRPKIILVPGE